MMDDGSWGGHISICCYQDNIQKTAQWVAKSGEEKNHLDFFIGHTLAYNL